MIATYCEAAVCGYCVRALTNLADVFIYDYVLTFAQEVQLIWGRKITGASVLFWLNRYLTLALVIMNFVPSVGVQCEVSVF